jgi:L-proline---[L-prolyl-carrier protein] ligase
MSESLAGVLRRTASDLGSRPAVVGPERSCSYGELDAQSDEIAAALGRLGVAPGCRVGVLRKKSVDTVAFLFGILKAGGAYVPIDARMGPNRLAAVLDDAGLAALVVEPATEGRLRELARAGLAPWLAEAKVQGEVLSFVAGKRGSAASRLPEPSAPDLAYILYTSGSTGVPKGVQHTHASALAFVRWAADELGVSSADRLSCHAPFHFDLTTFDLFAAALKGACVVLIPGDIAMFPRQVASLVEAERVTVWYSVPFALTQLLERGGLEARELPLREVVFAGERFPPAMLRRLAAALPRARLTNLFGPTETNVCTYHHLSPADIESDDHCPIGRPCPYAAVAVVDAAGREVSAGATGELLVGGASVMTGYLNRPELNAEVFVTRTVDGKTERSFRTGDLVSVPPGGAMRFHGRGDRQVKVRGFRVELDEVEAALASCAGVAAAGAWVDTDAQGFAEVQAAVARDPQAARPSGDGLVSEVRPRLPQAATPSLVLVLDELPRTGNGKVDYAALARAVGGSSADAGAEGG